MSNKPMGCMLLDKYGNCADYRGYTEDGQYVFTVAEVYHRDATHEADAPHRGQLVYAAQLPIPDGWALVPTQMALSPDDVHDFVEHVSTGMDPDDPDAIPLDADDMYAGATLIVGRLALDGEETDADATGAYGLHVYNPDYPDEGCLTLAEFEEPTRVA